MHSRRLNAAGLVFRTRPNWNRRSKPKIPRTFRRQLVRPREQAAARCRLLRGVRLRAAPSPPFHPAHEAERDGCFQARQRLHQLVRLHRLREGNQRQVDGHDPESRQRLLDQQACRLHHLNEAEANPADDLHSLARQPTRLEHRERRRRLLSVLRRQRQNMVDHQSTSWARVRVPVRLVVLKTFRPKVAARHLNVSDSALRRQLAPVRPGILAENSERHLGYVIPPAHLLWAALLAKRMARDNQVRALINLAGRRELERLLQQSMARDSRSMERKNPKREHLHQGHNNFGAIFTAAPDKNPGAAFFNQALPAVACAVLSAVVIRLARNSADDSGHYNNSAICTAFKAAPLSS